MKKLDRELERMVKLARRVSRPYRVTNGKHFHLSDVDPGDTAWLQAEDKPRTVEATRAGVQALSQLQEMLYAQNRWALLCIFQAMDAAGKDSAVEHVMSGVNPQGCQVVSFKAPSEEELDHDYLWRCNLRLPERGRIGIFNRSYYEEVLVVRVHGELLQRQRLPAKLVNKKIWSQRYRDIANYERYLCNNGLVIRKFFLHVSHDEQRRRFLDRIDEPEKNWKFSAADVRERAHWKEYMKAYQDMVRATASKHAPWYVVPADNKWFTRAVVAAALIETMASLDLHFPRLGKKQLEELAAARKELLAE